MEKRKRLKLSQLPPFPKDHPDYTTGFMISRRFPKKKHGSSSKDSQKTTTQDKNHKKDHEHDD